MKFIPANFPKPNEEYLCQCGDKEDMAHIYYCDLLSNGNYSKLEFETLYIGTLSEKVKIYEDFEENYERREILKDEAECKDMTPRDPSRSTVLI
jgi:hypothetical protein